jgi:hypothetical protein
MPQVGAFLLGAANAFGAGTWVASAASVGAFSAGFTVGNPLLRRAVEIAMDLGPFEEFVARDHGLEFDVIDEMVFAAVLLARPRPARGVGDGQVNAAFLLQQQADQRGLAGSRRRGDDKKISRHACFPDWLAPGAKTSL